MGFPDWDPEAQGRKRFSQRYVVIREEPGFRPPVAEKTESDAPVQCVLTWCLELIYWHAALTDTPECREPPQRHLTVGETETQGPEGTFLYRQLSVLPLFCVWKVW